MKRTYSSIFDELREYTIPNDNQLQKVLNDIVSVLKDKQYASDNYLTDNGIPYALQSEYMRVFMCACEKNKVSNVEARRLGAFLKVQIKECPYNAKKREYGYYYNDAIKWIPLYSLQWDGKTKIEE